MGRSRFGWLLCLILFSSYALGSTGVRRTCAELLSLPRSAHLLSVDGAAQNAAFCRDKIETVFTLIDSDWEGPLIAESGARGPWRQRVKKRLIDLASYFGQRAKRRDVTPDFAAWDFDAGELQRNLNITTAHLVHPTFSRDAQRFSGGEGIRRWQKAAARVGLALTSAAALAHWKNPSDLTLTFSNLAAASGIFGVSSLAFFRYLDHKVARNRALDDPWHKAGNRLARRIALEKNTPDWVYVGRTLELEATERRTRLSDLENEYLERHYSSGERRAGASTRKDPILNFIRFLQGGPEGTIYLRSDSFFDASNHRVYQWLRYTDEKPADLFLPVDDAGPGPYQFSGPFRR